MICILRTIINNKFKEGKKENANLFFLLVFCLFCFKLIPEEPKPWKHNSLLSDNIWLDPFYFLGKPMTANEIMLSNSTIITLFKMNTQ